MLSGIRWNSLRTKIIAWSFIPTVIILVAVALVTFYAYRQVTETLVIERDQELVRLSASQLTTELAEHTNLLVAIARTADIQDPNPAVQQAGLNQASNRLVIFDGGVVILNTFGRVVAAQPERPEIIGQNWSDRPYFRQMVSSPGPIFSDISLDGPQGMKVIILAVPITGDQGEFLGAILGMFRLGVRSVSAFYGGIVKLRLGESGSTYLVDGRGQVIYHSDTNQIGNDLSNQRVVQEALRGKAGAIRSRNAAGQEIVAGFAPVPGTPWSLITEENWILLTSASRNYGQFLLLLLVLGVILPTFVVMLGVRRIMRPIEELITAAQEVAKGNFSQTITTSTGDELAELAKQFNLMSAQVQESYALLEQRVADRTKELATLTKQLAILNAIGASANESLDLSKTLDRVLDETMGLLNLEVGEIRLLDEENDELIIRTQRGLSPEFVEWARRQKVTDLLPGTVHLSGEPFIKEDLGANSQHHLARQEGLHALAVFPLRAKERLLGTLSLATRRGPRPLLRNERELIRAISDQAAVAIENAELYAEASRRVDEIETLFAVQQAITRRLDLDAVLQLIADEARRLTEARASLVFLLEGDELCVSVLSGDDQIDVPLGYRMPLAQSLSGVAFRLRQPLRITDAPHEPRVYADLVRRLQAQSLMVIPLISGDELIGSISVLDKKSGAFSLEDERVLAMLASSAVIGLENARLYEEEQQRRQVAEGLRDILTILNSNRPLDQILEYIVAQAGRILGTDGVAIYRLQDKEGPLKVQASYGLPPEYVATIEIPLGQGIVGRAVLHRQPVTFPSSAIDIANDEIVKEETARRTLAFKIITRYPAILAVPLIIKNEVYGGMVLYYTELREFSDEEIGLAVSFADQAALAIENTRLFTQAQQAATFEERQRLARELHDSVTQALYGVTMFAEAATRLLAAGQPDMAADHLRELRSTAQEALQEMRLLIFELRPPVLEKEGLIAALQTRLEAVERRSGMETVLHIEGEEDHLPPDVEEGLYRIAQEALNNTLKHAQASQVKVHLQQHDQKVILEIVDNGCGFDLSTVYEHAGLGLRGIQERAAQLGADLTIDSRPGEGTKIKVEVQP